MKDYSRELYDLSCRIWDYAELKFEETRSAEAIASFLESEGFLVTRGIAGMETAFSASWGEGDPVIGFLGEYDALSGLSQEAGTAEKKLRAGTETGHGCGHNLLGSASAGAALLLRDYLKESGRPGTVVFFGCPGEEGGSGKTYMARSGIFDRLSAALTWHPGGGNAVLTGSFMANCQVCYRFRGTSSHAAAAPHLGRSALDAVELMDVGVNYMREHMEPTDRVHYAILDTGGISPNVVQNHAEVLYLIRSTDSEKVRALYERVNKIAKGAAMMTETEVEILFDKAASSTLSNSVLEDVLFQCMGHRSRRRYQPELPSEPGKKALFPAIPGKTDGGFRRGSPAPGCLRRRFIRRGRRELCRAHRAVFRGHIYPRHPRPLLADDCPG